MVSFARLVCTIFVIFFITSTSFAQEQVKVSGLLFGDYYYMLKNHDEDIEGENAFWIRRIYLTFDKELSDTFSFRFRFEANTAGDFTTKSKIEPFVKDAYLRWTKNNHNILMGISNTPTWRIVESFWRYRAVEKTPLELQKYSSSRDFGIAFQGYFDEERKVSYHYLLSNGNSTSSEVGKGKKSYLSLAVYPVEGLVVEGYFDYDDRPHGKRRLTVQGFAAYAQENYRIGILFAHQARRRGQNTNDLKLQIFSAFVTGHFNDKVSGFARYDRYFDPNPDGDTIPYIPFDPTSSSHFLLTGLDFHAAATVSIIPNIEIVIYDENDFGITPDADIIPRATISLTF